MNMFLHELKAYKKSTVIWTLSFAVLIVFYFSMFPSIAQEAEEFNKLIAGFPEPIRKALGLQNNIGFILGFYSYIFIYISICGGIQAMNLGVSIISKETNEKTADFLLTKPVTRIQIMTSKLLAALVSLIMTNTIYIPTVIIMAFIVETKEFSMRILLMISFALFFLQLIFLALGIIISMLVPRIRSILSITLATVFGFFVISLLVSATSEELMRYFTPFEYFDLPYIMENAKYEFSFIIAGIGFIFTSIAASYYIYWKKDASYA